MTNNNDERVVAAEDVPIIARAQKRVLSVYGRCHNWRGVGEHFGVNHRYAWDLALHGVVPSNPDLRVKLSLPRVMPSERRKNKTRRRGGLSAFVGGMSVE